MCTRMTITYPQRREFKRLSFMGGLKKSIMKNVSDTKKLVNTISPAEMESIGKMKSINNTIENVDTAPAM